VRAELEGIRAASDIVSVVGVYVPLRRLRNTLAYVGLCPFHPERTASFRADASRQRYHCFGCGADGDVFEFVQRIESVTFQRAKEVLASRAGIQIHNSLSREQKQQYVRDKQYAGRIADDLTNWRRRLIDELRRRRNAAWEAEQLACRLGRGCSTELCEEQWEIVWRAVMLQSLGDHCNHALNVIERTPADILLRFYRRRQAS
jgi:DNA primase